MHRGFVGELVLGDRAAVADVEPAHEGLIASLAVAHQRGVCAQDRDASRSETDDALSHVAAPALVAVLSVEEPHDALPGLCKAVVDVRDASNQHAVEHAVAIVVDDQQVFRYVGVAEAYAPADRLIARVEAHDVHASRAYRSLLICVRRIDTVGENGTAARLGTDLHRVRAVATVVAALVAIAQPAIEADELIGTDECRPLPLAGGIHLQRPRCARDFAPTVDAHECLHRSGDYRTAVARGPEVGAEVVDCFRGLLLVAEEVGE